MYKLRARRVAFLGVMTALALILSYVESLVPLPVVGVKLGLANLVTLFILYRRRAREAILVTAVRISLTALLFGSLLSLFYSFMGAAASLAVTLLLKRIKIFSTVGVSIGGSVFHNLGQLAAAVIILGESTLFYLPLLLVSGVVMGTVIGLLGTLLIRKIPSLPL